MEATEVKFPVPWGHIAGKIYGSPKEKKVLMVHGTLDNAGSFDRLLKYLPGQYQYVCIDLPGHGLSSAFPSGIPLNFFDYLYSVLLVLNALKWQTCTYIGHSFGAHIGTYFSIIYPGRLEKIIAIDGILPFLVKDIVSHVQNIYDLDSYAKSSSTLHTREEIIYALKWKRGETLTTEAAEALFPRAVTKVDNLFKYNRDPRLRKVVRPLLHLEQHREAFMQFSTPLLLIVADSSNFAPRVLNILKELKKIAKTDQIYLAIVKGNHDVHNNYPDRVAPHICKFLNELQSKL